MVDQVQPQDELLMEDLLTALELGKSLGQVLVAVVQVATQHVERLASVEEVEREFLPLHDHHQHLHLQIRSS